MNNNTTGITKRTDLKAYSADIYEVHLFCAHCDPEGMVEKVEVFTHRRSATMKQLHALRNSITSVQPVVARLTTTTL